MVEDKKLSTKNMLIGSIAVFVVYSVIMFMYKYNNETFSWRNLGIFMGIGILILGGLPLIYWYMIKREEELKKKLSQDLTSLPEPITIEECRKIRDKEILEQYENYLEVPEFEDTPSLGVGVKSSIYTCLAQAKYDDPYASEVYPKFFIAINMHYPDKKKAVCKDPTSQHMEKILSRIVSFPEGEPDTRETVERNPLLGTERVTKETVHKKEDRLNKSQEKEDFPTLEAPPRAEDKR